MNTPVFKEGEPLFGKVDVAELPVGAQIRLEYEIPELYLYYRAALRVSETEWAVSGRGTDTLRTAPTSEVLEMVEDPEVTRIILDCLPEQAKKPTESPLSSGAQRRAVEAALQGLYLRLREVQSFEGTVANMAELYSGSREIEAHARAVQDWAREQYISESWNAIYDTLAELSQLGEDGDLA